MGLSEVARLPKGTDPCVSRHFLPPSRRRSCSFAGPEPSCDLAILKVPVSDKLKALPLGPGSDLMEGETVFAIGHPYGYEFTVSTGIVSALGREIEMGEVTLKNLIQTTTSINPGNSGG